MQIKGKIFPYPILNNNKVFSNFKNQGFELQFEPAEDENAYILKNVVFSTDSETIKSLYENNKIEICLVVECSYTVFRKSFKISTSPKDIFLKKVDFTEKVDISLFAYAKEDFKFISNEFEDDYQGLEFDIEKYDILAAYDGFNVHFRHDESADNIVQSIFSIIINHNSEDGIYSVDCDGNSRKIVISLSEGDFKNYQVVYNASIYREVFFNMFLIPALIEALNKCFNMLQNENKDVDDICDQYIWFRSIASSFKKIEGKELSTEELKNTTAIELAQKLMGKPLGNSLEKLVNALKSSEVEENE